MTPYALVELHSQSLKFGGDMSETPCCSAETVRELPGKSTRASDYSERRAKFLNKQNK